MAQKIREDSNRLARLANQSNGHVSDKPISTTKKIEAKEKAMPNTSSAIAPDDLQNVAPDSDLPTPPPELVDETEIFSSKADS